MSYQRLEDPGIPLVGVNQKTDTGGQQDGGKNRPMYTLNAFNNNTRKRSPNTQRRGRCNSGDSGSRPQLSRSNSVNLTRSYRYENVGVRLALRKELYIKRKRTSDASLVVAVFGIFLMVLETELVAADVIDRSHPASIVLKICNTAATLLLLSLITLYYKLGVELFTVNNSMDDWRLAMRPQLIFTFMTEVLICIIHPIPGEYNISWYSTESDGNLSDAPVEVPLDVLFSLPMFLRLYLVCRYLMLHSRLYKDASCQSLGALNRINLNFRFVFKSLMALYPDYFLTVFMVTLFFITTWCLRLCEMYNDAIEVRVHGNILNNMWLIAITFLTVGYGDIVPNSFCGRGIAVVTGILGTGCTALIVAILARKLELSRAEKYVHNFVFEVDIGNQLRLEAANIIKNAWRLYKMNRIKRKTVPQERMTLKCQTKLLRSIYNIRELKDRRQQLSDNALSLVEVNKAQSEIYAGVGSINNRQAALEERLDRIEGVLGKLHDKICGPAAAEDNMM